MFYYSRLIDKLSVDFCFKENEVYKTLVQILVIFNNKLSNF